MSTYMHDLNADAGGVLRKITPGRSCLTCRRRKIRCDRGQPCGYCNKLSSRCIYPEDDSTEKPSPDADISTRLKRIEASLSRLEARGPNAEQQDGPRPLSELSLPAPVDTANGVQSELSPASGKLVVEELKPRFVNGSFWADLEEEDAEESSAPAELEEATDAISSAHKTLYRRNQAFVFGLSPETDNLRQLHPPPQRIFTIWQLYIEGVDPLLKIIHVPTTQRQILQASNNLDGVPPAFESLMFAIYYAAVTSLQCTAACKTLLHGDREELLDRYRFGVEQALARTNFMSTPELFSLQALTLYLICARNHAERTLVWTMTGIAIRLAIKLGLHRDPVSLGLPPFVSEMRRRLWSQIVILDVLTAEENDLDPWIYENSFDTKLPANVNDQDLDVNMTGSVSGDTRRTEMLFAMQRFEISYAARKTLFSDKFALDNGYKKMSPSEKIEFLDKLYLDLRADYLNHCDSSIPMCFITTAASRLILGKMKLTICHPARNTSSDTLKSWLPNLMRSSIDIIELTQALRAHEKYRRWIWLFQRYVEWDAIAFLLRSLSAYPRAEVEDEAWKLIYAFFDAWRGHVPNGSIIRRWQRLEILKAKAEARRDGDGNMIRPIGISWVYVPSQIPEGTAPAHPGSSGAQRDISNHRMATGTTHPKDTQSLDHQQAIFTYPGERVLTGAANASGLTLNNLSENENIQPINLDAWTFDNIPFAVDGGPSWDMDIDDTQFDAWV